MSDKNKYKYVFYSGSVGGTSKYSTPRVFAKLCGTVRVVTRSYTKGHMENRQVFVILCVTLWS